MWCSGVNLWPQWYPAAVVWAQKQKLTFVQLGWYHFLLIRLSFIRCSHVSTQRYISSYTNGLFWRQTHSFVCAHYLCCSIASHLALGMSSGCASQSTLLKMNAVRYVNSIDRAPQWSISSLSTTAICLMWADGAECSSDELFGFSSSFVSGGFSVDRLLLEHYIYFLHPQERVCAWALPSLPLNVLLCRMTLQLGFNKLWMCMCVVCFDQSCSVLSWFCRESSMQGE